MSNEIMETSMPSFEQIYKQYYNLVASTVYKFRFTNGMADDLIQNIFVAIWENLSNLKEPKALTRWIQTIARNSCLKELRKAKKTVSINPVDAVDTESGEMEVVLVADDDLASFHWEHSIQLIGELIKSHKGEPRATVARHFYLDSMSVKEISVQMDMKQNTVLSHLRRFRLIISEALIELAEAGELTIERV